MATFGVIPTCGESWSDEQKIALYNEAQSTLGRLSNDVLAFLREFDMEDLEKTLVDFGTDCPYDILLIRTEDCPALGMSQQQLQTLQLAAICRYPTTIAFQREYLRAITMGSTEEVAERRALQAAGMVYCACRERRAK